MSVLLDYCLTTNQYCHSTVTTESVSVLSDYCLTTNHYCHSTGTTESVSVLSDYCLTTNHYCHSTGTTESVSVLSDYCLTAMNITVPQLPHNMLSFFLTTEYVFFEITLLLATNSTISQLGRFTVGGILCVTNVI